MAGRGTDTRSPLRALLGAIVMALLLAIGVAVVLNFIKSDFGAFADQIFGRTPSATLWSRVAGWLAVGAGVLAILAAYVAWYEEPEFDGITRRGFPRYIPVFFFAATLALLWLAMSLLKKPEATPPTPPPAVAPAEEEPLELEGGEPVPEPQVTAVAMPLRYTFRYPLITARGAEGAAYTQRDLALAFPMKDVDGRVRALLCGKAWVALAGSASQEGDRDRNETRARLRAELAVARARTWLAAHADDCPAPALIGLDLGQHAAVVSAPSADGADTADQRQLIIVTRALRAEEDPASTSAALAEARAFYASNAGRTAVLGGRRYQREAEFFVAE
jgi:hypothetical protein